MWITRKPMTELRRYPGGVVGDPHAMFVLFRLTDTTAEEQPVLPHQKFNSVLSQVYLQWVPPQYLECTIYHCSSSLMMQELRFILGLLPHDLARHLELLQVGLVFYSAQTSPFFHRKLSSLLTAGLARFFPGTWVRHTADTFEVFVPLPLDALLQQEWHTACVQVIQALWEQVLSRFSLHLSDSLEEDLKALGLEPARYLFWLTRPSRKLWQAQDYLFPFQSRLSLQGLMLTPWLRAAGHLDISTIFFTWAFDRLERKLQSFPQPELPPPLIYLAGSYSPDWLSITNCSVSEYLHSIEKWCVRLLERKKSPRKLLVRNGYFRPDYCRSIYFEGLWSREVVELWRRKYKNDYFHIESIPWRDLEIRLVPTSQDWFTLVRRPQIWWIRCPQWYAHVVNYSHFVAMISGMIFEFLKYHLSQPCWEKEE